MAVNDDHSVSFWGPGVSTRACKVCSGFHDMGMCLDLGRREGPVLDQMEVLGRDMCLD
jgi:hypothetical protein